jgi:hypothetical protein
MRGFEATGLRSASGVFRILRDVYLSPECAPNRDIDYQPLTNLNLRGHTLNSPFHFRGQRVG